jgi:hypothetical protein
VSRRRTLLSPDAALIAQGGGYALAAEPGRLDAGRFEQLIGSAREALERGEAAVAASRFRTAHPRAPRPPIAGPRAILPDAQPGVTSRQVVYEKATSRSVSI